MNIRKIMMAILASVSLLIVPKQLSAAAAETAEVQAARAAALAARAAGLAAIQKIKLIVVGALHPTNRTHYANIGDFKPRDGELQKGDTDLLRKFDLQAPIKDVVSNLCRFIAAGQPSVTHWQLLYFVAGQLKLIFTYCPCISQAYVDAYGKKLHIDLKTGRIRGCADLARVSDVLSRDYQDELKPGISLSTLSTLFGEIRSALAPRDGTAWLRALAFKAVCVVPGALLVYVQDSSVVPQDGAWDYEKCALMALPYVVAGTITRYALPWAATKLGLVEE